jgi:hypothetical protein
MAGLDIKREDKKLIRTISVERVQFSLLKEK